MARRRKLWRSLDRLAGRKLSEGGGAASEESDLSDISSPCNGYCRLLLTGLCKDCGRTLEEISGWMHFSRDRKQAVLRAAASRLQDAG
jgi:predicted Fe-S protein YdhL (DUF1289 family)